MRTTTRPSSGGSNWRTSATPGLAKLPLSRAWRIIEVGRLWTKFWTASGFPGEKLTVRGPGKSTGESVVESFTLVRFGPDFLVTSLECDAELPRTVIGVTASKFVACDVSMVAEATSFS